MRKSVVWKGKEYPSLEKLAEACGMPAPVVSYRLNAGYSVDDACDPNFEKTRYTLNGKSYKSLKDLGRDVGVNPSTIRKRLKEGKSLEDACTKDCYVLDGVEYESQRAAAKALGLTPSALSYRTQTYGSHEIPARYTYNGCGYDSVKALAEGTGTSQYTLSKYLNEGMSVEDAVYTAIHGKPGGIDYKGVHYLSQKDMCEKLGISLSSFTKYKKRCPSLEEAIEACLSAKEDAPIPQSVTYGGISYSSIHKLCVALNLKYSLIQERLRSGWTVENAVETPGQATGLPTSVEWEGVCYSSKQELYNALGIKKDRVNRLIRDKQFTFEEAVKTAQSETPKGIFFNGVHYATTKKLAEDVGVGVDTLRKHLRRGMSPEEAVDLARSNARNGITVSGQYYSSTREALLALNVNSSDLSKYREYYRSDSECIEQLHNVKDPDFLFVFDGKECRGVEETCSNYGLVYSTVRFEMCKGKAFEEAVFASHYYYDGKYASTQIGLAEIMGVSREVVTSAATEHPYATPKELVEIITRSEPELKPDFSVSLSIKKRIGSPGVCSLRDGRYLVICPVCNRRLLLSYEDAMSFEHSEEFCSTNIDPIFSKWSDLTIERIREMIRRKGSLEGAINAYEKYYVTKPLRSGPGKLIKLGQTSVFKCLTCGRRLLTSTEDYDGFTHDEQYCKEHAITVNTRELVEMRVEGLYIATCRNCARKLLLTVEELQSFEHSEEFCSAHEWEE